MTGDLTKTTIHRFPHGFINRRAEPILITPLTRNRHGQLLEMYLDFPRNGSSGLPPIRDEACEKWVLDMAANGVSLVGMSFDHAVVAHGALFPLNEKACKMFMAVRHGDQNVGIGSEMARSLIQLGQELGFGQIRISVEAGNHSARHVCEKSGFRRLDRAMTDEVDMSLDLDSYRGAVNVAVRDIMDRHVIVLHPEMPCKVALMIFLQDRVEGLPVVQGRNELVGMLTATDLMVEENIDRKVRDVMTRQAVAVQEAATVAKVITLLRSRNLRCVPVLNSRKEVVGVVRRKEVLAHYLNRYAERLRQTRG